MKVKQIEQIESYLISEGFRNQELIDDLKDHLAIEVEELMANGKTFEEGFELAKRKILPDNPYQLEQDLKLLTTQKHNIMIKKLAYIGGYLSALTIVLALLFMSLSYQNGIQVEKRTEILKSDVLKHSISQTNGQKIGEKDYTGLREFYDKTGALSQTSLKQMQISQTLMILAILIFVVTYLPYRFYSGYQKSQLELT